MEDPTALRRSEGNWRPPRIPATAKDLDRLWVTPPIPRRFSPGEELTGDSRVRLAKIRYWHGFVFIVVMAILANRERLPGLWAQAFYRKPTEEWIKVTASQKMPVAFANGNKLTFEVAGIRVLREAPGLAAVTVSGTATTKEPFYEPMSITDPLLEMENKLRELRAAEDRAHFLQDRAGVQINAVDESAFHFLKEITPVGQSAQFEFQFKARRDRFEWAVEEINSASIAQTTALLGKPISDFTNGTSSPAISGSEKAKSDMRELTAQIDQYVASVSEAERKAKKQFASEGRDERGDFLFPPNEAMLGERFAVTRMRVIQPDELQSWSEEDLQYAINELFARHGAEFPDKKLAGWFHQFNWYHPKPKLSYDQIESSLPDIESQNVKTLGYARNVKRDNARAAAAQRAQAMAIMQAQQQQLEAQQRAQQEAAIRAQQEEAARQMIGNLLQGIANGIPHR